MVNNESYTPVKFTKEGSYFYYYDENGNKVTGVQKINGFYYLFGTVDGVLKTEWQSPNGIRYYYSTEDGNPVFGIVKWHGRFYYVDEQEGKIINKTITIDGLDYTFDENGILTNDADIDVKDKLITLESLGLLHLYAENTYMKKEENVGITYHNSEHGEIFNDYEDNVASGQYSSASGAMTSATGDFSNANGNMTTASGDASESSGINSVASGFASNANNSSTAPGDYANSYGYYTDASGYCQNSYGKFNVVDDENKYVIIIGNGTDNNNRSNIFTIDWDGNVVSDGDIVATKTNGEYVSLLETADLANNLNIYSKNLRTNIYVNASTGNDDNDGLSSVKPLKTLDRAVELAGYYRDVTILLAEGYTYAATDKTNAYGTGIHLYNCSIKLMSDGSSSVKVQNAIFVYDGNFETKNIDLKSSNSGITLYNSFGNFENSTMQIVNPNNCVITMNNCTTPYILQYGGHSSVYGGAANSIQVENGGFLNFTNCSVTGYASAPPSIICQNGVPVYMIRAKRIAEESIETIIRYVDSSSGSDSSPGTESAPYRTLDAALSDVMYAKKAIIYLSSGEYTIPNKTVTWINKDIRIYGNTKEDTIIKGNIVAENSLLLLTRVTVDSTNSETANMSTSTITAQYGAILRMNSCIVNTAYNMCVNCTETSKSYLTNCTFSGALQYAVHTTGFGDVRIYQCSDNSEKGVRSGGGSVVYITNSSSGIEFPYTNGNYGIVYVNGQQVLPQTEESAAILSMGGNV